MPKLHNDELNDETLVVFGGSVKALGNGKVGGYLVRFTTDEDPDLEGEYFTKETDFGPHTSSLVFYQHGLDGKLRRRVLDPEAKISIDDIGAWIEAQIRLRDEYEEFIYGAISKGKMGWSSGTASHLVEREQRGKAVWLKSWILGIDASITPTPAEPRNIAIPLKTWQPPDIHWTLAERIASMCGDMNILTNDMQAFVKTIDRPLSETKRKELTELLESCSGMDAVRSDLQSVLTSAPTQKLVEPKLIGFQLADIRKRLRDQNILQE